MKNFYSDLDVFGDNVAIIGTEGRKHTYDELLAQGDALAALLPSRSLVFLVCSNQFASVAAYVGLLRAKIVPVLLSPSIDAELFDALLDLYKPQAVIAPVDFYYEGAGERQEDGYKLSFTPYETPPIMGGDLAVLLTTSGSTGSPKLVRQTYRNVNSNAAAIAEYLGISSFDRPITTLPMNYTFGLSIIQSHLLRGASIVLTEYTLMEKAFWDLLRETEATTFGGVPYIYEMLKKLRFERMDLPSLRVLTQAGGKLSPELAEEYITLCEKKNMRFIIMYGQTEATARMSYLPWESAASKPGSIGVAIPGGEFLLEDADGSLINAPDIVGELLYKGTNVTPGYAQSCDDLAKGDENGGLLRTGDMAKRDADGFYYIVGRKKRFLKVFGNRVNLDELEGLLKKEGYDCVCGGADDHLRIYLVGGGDAESARAFASTKTGLNMTAFTVVLIPEIPRSESGKILYSQLENIDA